MAWSQRQMVAVKVDVGPSIMLQSGAWLDLCAPAASEFTIEDIAHGLANLCRYAGQCRGFYSVAEHSLLVTEVATEHQFEALLHDAAEAFLGDITRPLKQMLPDYRRIEQAVQAAIFERFGLPAKLPAAIKEADLKVLAAEQRQIMPDGTDEWAAREGIEPAAVTVRNLSPQEAKEEFLNRFEQLYAAYIDRPQGFRS